MNSWCGLVGGNIGFGYFGVFVMAETVVFISATFSSIGAFLRELWPFLCFRGPRWVILEYIVLFFTFGGSRVGP